MTPGPISGDSWNGRLDQGWRIETPSIDDLDRAIDRLDAETHTMVTVEGAGEAHLTIGGGAGRYVVYATFDNEAFWNLVRPDAITGVVMVNAGGQEGDYPACQAVDLARARAAAHSFFLGRELDPGQAWEAA